ncbi:MAG: hypothetical protein M3419_11740 [Actinomycetota bacterium]|nr:hypothetical protein [Actinomycetota bacterium]
MANQTLAGEPLLDAVKERIDAGECHFHVVVPATPSPTDSTPQAAERAHALASQRLSRALADISEIGGGADGEVGDPEPLEAVRLSLTGQEPDEIIVSTLPLGRSRWLRRDLPTQVRNLSGLPVTHVVQPPPT